MNISIQIFNEISSVTMPVPGVIKVIPNVNDVIRFVPDSINSWAGQYSPSFYIDEGEPSKIIRFHTDTFKDESSKLLLELKEIRESLKRFRLKFTDNLSFQPKDDPFQPIVKRENKKIHEKGLLLVTLLWNEELSDLLNTVPTEKYPVLENRIIEILSNKAVSFCSKLISLSISDTKKLAALYLSIELRSREGIVFPDPLHRNFISHPSAQFQTVYINDPVIYKNQSITSTLEDFDSTYRTFNEIAREYWEKVGEKKLYLEQDIQALKNWKVIPPHPGFEIEDVTRMSPIEKLDIAWNEWQETKSRILKDSTLIYQIIFLGFICSLDMGFPSPNDLPLSERGRWLAQQAVDSLGFSDDLVEGHVLTWDRAGEFLLRFLALDFSSIAEDLAPDYKTRLMQIADSIAKSATNHIMATQKEYRMQHVYGETTLRFSPFVSSARMERDLKKIIKELVDIEVGRNYNKGTEIINELLRNPRTSYEKIRKLQEWRQSFQESLTKRLPNSPEIMFEKYLRRFEELIFDAEEIREALSYVDRINALTKVTDEMLQRLGNSNFGEGKVRLPIDTRVIGVQTTKGEFVSEGHPLLTLKNRFSCRANAFLTTQQVTDAELLPDSIWKIELNGLNEAAPNIFYVCLVKGIIPNDTEEWIVDLRIFPAFSPNLDKISNLPQILPLSSRYVDDNFPYLTDETLEIAEQSLPVYGSGIINLIERIY